MKQIIENTDRNPLNLDRAERAKEAAWEVIEAMGGTFTKLDELALFSGVNLDRQYELEIIVTDHAFHWQVGYPSVKDELRNLLKKPIRTIN